MIQHVSHGTIIDLLALTLDKERAQTAWGDAVRGLGIPVGELYATEQALVVLSGLAIAPGPVGLAARVARLRLQGGDPSATPGRGIRLGERPERPSGEFEAPRTARGGDRAPPSGPAVPTTTVPPSDPGASGPASDLASTLLSLLTPSLGEEKAVEALDQSAAKLKVRLPTLSRDDAIAMLDSMSATAGLLGVVARFAKVRFLLRYPA
jgi:hypothetical protein